MFALLTLLTALAGAPMPLSTIPLTTLQGTPMPEATLAGKVVLFVNVASQCGYTPQYAGLEQLWNTYRERGLVVVGVPCNQFGAQEPGSAEQIQSFCKLNYGVDFPLLEKQEVNGAGRSALYTWLVGSGANIKWNFEKFLVGRDGVVRGRFGSGVAPESAELRAAIEAAL